MDNYIMIEHNFDTLLQYSFIGITFNFAGMGNTIGELFRLTTFGESHGEVIGGVIDGCPPGIPWDEAYINQRMARRKAGNTAGSTPR
ncbi:MAG: chorismate synthase, partial [Bacteroidales bacterium]|nr:chorismate synthase [Bacteroidales bacterium]